ncbi:MAG: hypothetical protein OEW98_01645 [Betaproteobacteria bacterium]|jgi:hypothetical protein|nr:hypothetical protein [Betaproteobacteria bacterium]
MSQHQSILEFRHGRYFKVALLLCVAAIGAYAWHDPPAIYLKPYGGTWLGYTLGTIGAVLILWLMVLGIRKRRYRSTMGSVQGWTSAHIYLGGSLIIVATLHCAFEFGWNIHTLAYALMMLVIASGFFGVYAYLRYPEYMTANLAGETLETMLLKVADLEAKCKRIALDLPDEVNALIMNASKRAAEKTALGGSFRRQLAGVDPRHPMRLARDELLKMGTRFSGDQAKVQEQLVMEMTRVVALTDRVRRDLQFRALMQVWLYFHVPLSFALLAALIAHVVSVFYFW